MRAKLSYKSKRNIVIALIIMVLFAASVTTTYFFIKGNQDSSAAFTGNDSQTSENTPVQGSTEGENNPEGNGEVVVPNVNDNNGENATTTPEENQTTTRPTTQIGQNNPTGNGTATTTQTTGAVPNEEYVTERIETEEVLVSENYAVAWAPLAINADTTTSGRSIVRPEITAVKTANASAVANGELEYTIDLVNAGKEDGVAVVTDEVPEGTSFVEGSIKVNGEETTYTVEDLVKGISVEVAKNNGTAKISFKVKVNENVKGTIVNTAFVNDEETNTTKTPVITFAKDVDVKEIKIDSNNEPEQNKPLEYTITLTNKEEVAGKVTVKDSIPEGTKPEEGAMVSINGKATEISVDKLNEGIEVEVPAKGTVTISFKVTVVDTTATISNTAFVNDQPTETIDTKVEGIIIFVTNGGTSVNNMTGYAGEEIANRNMPTTTKEGYIFKGWYAEEELTNEVKELEEKYVAGTTYYYAKWEARTDLSYTVNYLEKGTNEVLADEKVVDNQTFGTSVTEEAIEIAGYDKVAPTEKTITIEVEGNVVNFYYTKRTDLSYTVNYLEEGTNKVLADAKVVDAQTFKSDVTEEAIDIEGYDKVEPTEKTITIEVEGNVINFYYTKRTDLSYTVNYLEEGTNKVLAEAKTVDGQTFKSDVTEEAIDIEGYDKVSPTSKTITIEVEGNVINFYYTKRTDLSYTVNYLEKGTDAVLHEAKTVDGQTFGASVTEKAIEIAGYDKVAPTEKTITIEVEGNVINFYYTKRTDLSYTVNYLEEGTNKVLAEAKTVDGQTFKSDVTEEAIDIEGYDKVEPTSKTITIEVEGNVINFYYTKRTDLSYTVNYLEKGTDAVLHEAKTVDGQTFGASVTEKAIEIAGYDKVAPTEKTITIEVEGNVINFYYTKRTDLSYTVNYLEEGTNKVLADAKVVSGQTFKSNVTEEAIDIEGYSKVAPTEKTITIEVEGNVINFYYTKRTDLSYTVNYLEKGTNKILADEKVVDNQTFGISVTEEAIEIAGYDKVNPTEKTITIDVENNVINFYYTKRTDLSYTVNYLEEGTNKVLAEAKTVDGQTFGASVTEEAIDIEGYSKVESTSKTITIKVEGNVINFYYTINTYTITYIVDGQYFVENPYASQEYTYGERITRVDALEHEGYTFSGWLNEDGTEAQIPETMPAHNIVVYGHYTIETYTVTYKIVGDYFTADPYGRIETYNYNDPVTARPVPATKEGYTFSGWSEIPSTMPAEDVVVTGRYTINSHKITYKIVGDYYTNDKYAEDTYNYGAKVTPEPVPENKPGYTFSGWSTIPSTMPDRDVEVTGRYTKMPDPSLEFTKTALNLNKQTITKFVYTPNGNNSFYYRLKLENTVANSYPPVVADKQVVTDTLPEGIELDGDLPEGVTSKTENGRITLTWEVANIGKGDNAKYVDIKVKASEQVFKSEAQTETNQTLFSDIVPNISGSDKNVGTSTDRNNTASLFIRFARETDGNKGYIYAGSVKNVNVSGGSETIVGAYNDTKINNTVSDTSKNKDMFDAFIAANNQGGTIYNCLNGNLPSKETVNNYLSSKYNITLSDTQVVLWYKVVNSTGEKSRTRTYSIYNQNTKTTTTYNVDMPACTYHIDGIIVDISSLRTIPVGAMVPVTNTASATIAINGATTAVSDQARLEFYYKQEN